MPTIFTVEVLGEEQVARILDGVEYRAQDMRPVWQILAEDFYQVEEEQFATEGGFSGGWAELSERYKAWKEAHYPGQPILVLTGALREALTTPNAAGSIYDLQRDYMMIGASRKEIPYGPYHQTGWRSPKRWIKARPPIALPESTKERWVAAIHAYLKGADLGAALSRRSIF